MGLNFVQRQRKATGAPIADVARAYTTVMEVFSVAHYWDQIEALDNQVESDVQLDMMLELIRLVKRSVRWILRNRRHDLAPTKAIAEFTSGLVQLRKVLLPMLTGGAEQHYNSSRDKYVSAGVPAELAAAVAGTDQAYKALGIIQAAGESQSELVDVAQVYFLLGERLELDWFSGQINNAKIDNEWQALARDTYMEDLEWQQRTLATGALRHVCEQRDIMACLERWEAQESVLIKRWKDMLSELHATDAPDFAMYAVANRELLDLAQSSTID
jgi:glutamate dehydrogenase